MLTASAPPALNAQSAAVMLELLYFYALAHQARPFRNAQRREATAADRTAARSICLCDRSPASRPGHHTTPNFPFPLSPQDSFDVRWIAKKSIAELMIAPLAERLAERHGVEIRGGCRVEGLDVAGGRVTTVRYSENGQQKEIAGVDGVVLAVGTKGLRAIVSGSPQLARAAPELASAAALSNIDVISTRLWLDRVVPAPHPANVFSRFDELRGAGGTYFMLDQLQGGGANASPAERDAAMRELWGLGSAAEGGPADTSQLGSVVAADFYFSGALNLMPDDAIVSLLSQRLLPATVPEFAGAKVLDSFVLRCPGAVSWFSPGSFASRPPLQTSLGNVVCAGDWVRACARVRAAGCFIHHGVMRAGDAS